MNLPLALLSFLTALTALRWSWNLGLALSPESAYLAICGTIPSLAYFDGPGGTPVGVALGVSLFGGNALGAAFLWPVYAMLATLALYGLVLSMAGPRPATSVAVLLNLLPIFNRAALDPSSALPLAASALGALACAWRGLSEDSLRWWFAAGCLMACGLFFSYAAWLLPSGILIAMAASHRWRRRLTQPGFWMTWAPPLIVMWALLQWNVDHGWVHFIGNTMVSSLNIHWTRFPGAMATAAVSISPLTMVALTLALWFGLRETATSPKIKFLFFPALVALAAWLYSDLRGLTAQTPGLLATVLILPLLVWIPSRLGRVPTSIFVNVTFVTSALWTVGALVRHPHESGFIDNAVVENIEYVASSFTPDNSSPPLLIAEDEAIASAVAVHLPGGAFTQAGDPVVYTIESAFAESQYALWPRYDQFTEAPPTAETSVPADPFTEQDGANPFLGRSALYITRQQPDDLPQAITAAFGAWRLVAEISALNGKVLRIYLCSDYQTMPL